MVDSVGQRLDDYRLDRLLGEGAFGKVYLGEHIYRKQQVAIKVLQPLAYDDLPGFLNEARSFRLKHPNIVQVIDFGLEGNLPFLVMDYAPNGTLRQRHPRGTQLPLDTIVFYVKQIADALQYAHNERLVHRDIKPENMLIGPKNEVLVSDFGLATMTRSSRSFDTKGIAGTVAYMAPEQIQGKPCAASDQYALGIVIYEWISGHLPFNGSLIEIATQHMLTTPPSLLIRVPELSPEVEHIILKALEKEPNKRFANVREFVSALEKFLTPPIGTTLLVAENPDYYRPPIVWSPDGRYLALSIYNENMDVQEYSVQIWSVANKNFISVSYDGAIQIWDARTGDTITSLVRHYPIKNITWSANSECIASINGYVGMLTWSPTSSYFAAVENGSTVNIWDANTGSSIYHYDHHNYPNDILDSSKSLDSNDFCSAIYALAWSPDGRYLASCSSYSDDSDEINTVEVFDVAVKEIIFIYRNHPYAIHDVAWSPDSKRVASVSVSEIHIWDATTGDKAIVCNKYANFQGHSEEIETIAWSPHDRYLASGNNYGEVDVWDVSTGNIIFTYNGHIRPEKVKRSPHIEFVTWSATGQYVASLSSDGTICIWAAPH